MIHVLITLFLLDSKDVHAKESNYLPVNKYEKKEVQKRAKEFIEEMGCSINVNFDIIKFSHNNASTTSNSIEQNPPSVFYIASCGSGAYNHSSVLFYKQSKTKLSLVKFTVPLVSINEDGSIKNSGLAEKNFVGQLSYQNNNLISLSIGRGDRQLKKIGTYGIVNSKVVLEKFEFDATVDDIDNPTVVYHSP
ncbi:MAG: hypothetical protein K1X29_09960 [Bdellovibrionales bacterium]|nr:hypothetical protein [Bdellovibrionales bacterium]